MYETDHKPGKNSDGSEADDMKVNDFDNAALLEQNPMFIYELRNFDLNWDYDYGVKSFTDSFKDMIISFFTDNLELRNVVLQQIDNFVSENPKEEYENDVLNFYTKNHDSTRKLIEKVKKAFLFMLKEAKGDIMQVCYIDVKKESNKLKNELHWSIDKSKDWTPFFSSKKDRREGLTIAVNDVWGYTISVKDYVLSDGRFSCTLHFSMYDDFGLNKEDFHEGVLFEDYWAQSAKRMLAGFRAWFFLQHYTGFEGKYKPFITRMNFEEEFKGEL